MGVCSRPRSRLCFGACACVPDAVLKLQLPNNFNVACPELDLARGLARTRGNLGLPSHAMLATRPQNCSILKFIGANCIPCLPWVTQADNFPGSMLVFGRFGSLFGVFRAVTLAQVMSAPKAPATAPAVTPVAKAGGRGAPSVSRMTDVMLRASAHFWF